MHRMLTRVRCPVYANSIQFFQLQMRLDDDSDKKKINLPWWGNIA